MMFLFERLQNIWEKKVVKDYLSVTVANIIIQPLNVVKGFIIAGVLGPENYGILKSIEVIPMLSKFGSFGFRAVANREISHAIGEGDILAAEKYRNTNYTAEIILAFILFLIGSISSFFFESYTISILIVLASISLFFSKIESLYRTEYAIQKRFFIGSKISLFYGFLLAVLSILLVYLIGIYAVFTANIISWIAAILVLRKYISFPFKFEIDKNIFKYSLKVGIPFTIATLSLGMYKYAERLIVLDLINVTAVGYFTFAMTITNTITILFKAAIKVRLQDIWRLIGAKQYNRLHRMVVKESFLLTLFSILLIPAIWVLMSYLIPYFLPKYIPAIPVINVLLFVIPFQVIANYTGAVTVSKTVNKLIYPIVLRFISLGLFVGGAYYLHSIGELNIISFAYLNLLGYAFYNMGMLAKYYSSYYLNYIKLNK